MGLDPLDLAVVCCLIASVVLYTKRENILTILRGSDSLDPAIGINSNGSKDLIEIIESNKKDFLILYGSQTGTSEDYCKKFAKELHSKFKELNILCSDFENFDFDEPNTLGNLVGKIKGLVIFMSTYGEGELPDPCVNFENYLNNIIEKDEMSGLPVMIFGLGNSTYEFFNGAAVTLKKKLVTEGGAKLLGEVGAGDDSIGSTEEEYVSWKETAFEIIEKEFNLTGGEDAPFEPMYEYVNYEGSEDTVFQGELNKNYLTADKKHLGPFDQSYPFLANVLESRELCDPESGRNCVHMEFDISGSNIKYETGDHLGVIPQNAKEHVSKFLSTLGLNGDEVFDLKLKDPTSTLPFPVPTNIETAVTNYLEITGPVSRQMITQLIQFIPDTEEKVKQRLVEISSSPDVFHKEVIEANFNFTDCLNYVSPTFQWGQYIPWTFLLETIPSLKPRFYSISSSNLKDSDKISVTAMVEVTDAKKLVCGVTTNLLNEINKGPENAASLPLHYNLSGPRGSYKAETYKMPVFVRKSTFRLPKNLDTPVIMIGPGTGVAPFRGFIRDRLISNKEADMMLFYGCRNVHDHLYKEECEKEYIPELKNLKVFTGYSRDPTVPKTYVQKLMLDEKDLIMEALKKGAFVYVCGDAGSMAKQVNDTLVTIISEKQDIEIQDAQEMVKLMKLNGRYHEDVW